MTTPYEEMQDRIADLNLGVPRAARGRLRELLSRYKHEMLPDAERE
jgi:hypothetical protein